jgi:hypothetical protein
MTTMLSSSDLLTSVLVAERERETARAAALGALLRAAPAERDHRHSWRERLGFSLIQAGRALLRHRPAYAAARRGVA